MANIPLPGTVQQAPAGSSGIDVNSVLSAKQAQAFKAAGNTFCLRYIPRVPELTKGCLTNAEALIILNAGLALMPVQHVTPVPKGVAGWIPSEELGITYGKYAASYSKDVVGLPPGLNVWNDLEGITPGTATEVVIAYCKAWFDAVSGTGYVPGLYIGFHNILTPGQLFNDLPYQHYWKAYNRDDGVATRGYQLIQTPVKPEDKLDMDHDTTQNDDLGGTVLWLSK